MGDMLPELKWIDCVSISLLNVCSLPKAALDLTIHPVVRMTAFEQKSGKTKINRCGRYSYNR